MTVDKDEVLRKFCETLLPAREDIGKVANPLIKSLDQQSIARNEQLLEDLKDVCERMRDE